MRYPFLGPSHGRLRLYRPVAPLHPVRLPLFGSAVQAGFPSPADDHIEGVISLDEELIQRPAATFLVRVKGCSMRDANIDDGDVLVVDRSLTPESGDIVVAVLNGELTVKTLELRAGCVRLLPANPAFPAININGELQLWGVVTSTIRRHRRASR